MAMKRNSYLYLAALLLVHTSSVVDAQTQTAQTTQVITVGKAAHKFSPDLVKATVGDLITFEFYPTNHSVVRGALDFPCIPYEKVTPEVDGFFAGFHPVKTIPKDPPKWSVVVNDTNPIYFYCSAPDSCDHWGMVGVINPVQDSDLDKYRSGAKNASYVLQPGQDWPSEAESNTAVHSATIPPTATSTSSSSASAAQVTVTTSPAPSTSSTGTQSISTGGIAGIAIGTAAVVGLIGGLFFFLGRKKSEPRPTTPAPEKPPVIIYPSPHPSTLSGFRPGVDPVYAIPGYVPHDPRSYPPRSVGTASPIGDEQKVYGPWRYSGQSRDGRPVEIDNGDDRDAWIGGGYPSGLGLPPPGVYPVQGPPPGAYPPQGPPPSQGPPPPQGPPPSQGPPPQGWYSPDLPNGHGPPSTTTDEPPSNTGGNVEPSRAPRRDDPRRD